jgi:hypothetical protein
MRKSQTSLAGGSEGSGPLRVHLGRAFLSRAGRHWRWYPTGHGVTRGRVRPYLATRYMPAVAPKETLPARWGNGAVGWRAAVPDLPVCDAHRWRGIAELNFRIHSPPPKSQRTFSPLQLRCSCSCCGSVAAFLTRKRSGSSIPMAPGPHFGAGVRSQPGDRVFRRAFASYSVKRTAAVDR